LNFADEESIVWHNLFRGNGGGVDAVGRATYYFNAFVDNGIHVQTHGPGNIFSVDGHGNYWSDYTEIDADGNGIGDTPYTGIGNGNRDDYPLIRSPFEGLVRRVGGRRGAVGQTVGIGARSDDSDPG